MSSIPHASGVYQILCIPTSKVYIGSATDLRERWFAHRNRLRRSIHVNKYLQQAWNKYGEEQFIFSVLELVSVSVLRKVEQQWIDVNQAQDRKYGFNSFPRADSPLGFTMPEEAIEKIRKYHARIYEGFIDPEGKEVELIDNIRLFCDEHGLSVSAMRAMAAGDPNFQSHKGWTHKNSPPRRPRSKPPIVDNAIVWSGFIDPNGNEVGPIANLPAFCRERGLIVQNMYLVAYGKRQSHRGWSHTNAAPYKTKSRKRRY